MYAVASRKDGTATAALVVTSAALLFVASFGNRITTLKYGDLQLDLAATFLIKARAAKDRGDTDAEAQYVGAALHAAGVSTDLSSAVDVTSTRRLHRDAVFNTLAAMTGATVTYAGTPIDGFVTIGGTRIGVDVRAGPKSGGRSIERVRSLRLKGENVDALLIVVPKGKDARLKELANAAHSELEVPVHVLRWAPEIDDAATLVTAASTLAARTVTQRKRINAR